MKEQIMRGVFSILVTPFDEAYRIDEPSLRNLVEYQIEAGVHGLGVAMGSEIFRLTESERARVTRVIVDQARGRVPVVVNASGTGTETAVHYSRMAEDDGADALMLTPPIPMGMGGPAGPDGIREYFCAVSAAVNIPIFIQSQENMPVPAGLACQIARECENVLYIKEEVRPTPSRIADLVRQAGDTLVVFGGAGGGYFIEEMERGAQGTMPGCSQPEAFVRTWDLSQKGEVSEARRMLERTQRLARVSGMMRDGFFHVHKELLRQRGIIRTAVVRGPVAPWPDDDLLRHDVQEAIDEYLAYDDWRAS